MDPRLWRRGALLCLLLVALAGASIAVAGGNSNARPPDGGGGGGGGNSSATINGSFSDNCRDFRAESSKDISYVEIHYADGRVEKDESVNSRTYSKDGTSDRDRIDYVIVKSGTTKKRFDCGGGGGDPKKPQCSDNEDNDGDKKVDRDDPGCYNEKGEYDPNDDDETDGGGGKNPQCSDNADNDGDNKVDEDDPGCIDDKGNYDPNDDDERDGPPAECSDGFDNDGDTQVDENDLGCYDDNGNYDPNDDNEADDNPQCSDRADNDDDGKIDADDPGCIDENGNYDPNDDDETDPTRQPQCSDGDDNDDDGKIDADDPGCINDGTYDPNDDDETDPVVGPSGRWTCRASVLRVSGHPFTGGPDPFEPIVANPAGDPCADREAGVPAQTLRQAGTGSIRVRVLNARTDDSDAGPTSEAGVAEVVITDERATVPVEVLRVGVLNARATGRCEGGSPELDGSSEVVGLRVMGNSLPVGSAHQDVPLQQLGTIHLNEQTESGGVLTQRAVFWDNSPFGDIVIGEAIADVHGDPCPG